jgi:hypothetical protein
VRHRLPSREYLQAHDESSRVCLLGAALSGCSLDKETVENSTLDSDFRAAATFSRVSTNVRFVTCCARSVKQACVTPAITIYAVGMNGTLRPKEWARVGRTYMIRESPGPLPPALRVSQCSRCASALWGHFLFAVNRGVAFVVERRHWAMDTLAHTPLSDGCLNRAIISS